ncbi:MAG: alkaline phosphatase family protein [Candidatus Zixiibacteriota bacterium]
MSITRFSIIFLSLMLALLSPAISLNAQENPPSLKLVVLIVVDQMRSDYLARFDSLYTGGLARLSHQGFVFNKAFHNHAHTETGPGHATIATGAFPGHHGIVANSWFDDSTGKSVYCIFDSTATIGGHPELAGRSPVNLRRGGITDLLNRGQLASKVYAVAAKDRAAVLMAGYSADGAYWYNSGDGTMVTSLFYTAVYPEWAAAFNASWPADQYYSGVWDRFAPLADYRFSGPDSVAAESNGKDIAFPHIFSPRENDDPKTLYDNLLATPFADHLVLRFARELVCGEGLGLDDTLDLLMIGCSAADYVGHTYGPRSHEVEDYYLRLDHYLGEFFAFLDSTVGLDRYAVALSSDHGALELPETQQKQGVDAGRINPDSLESAILKAGLDVAGRIGIEQNVIRRVYGGVFLDFADAQAKGISKPELEDIVATELRKIPYIADAYTSDEMAASGGSPRLYLEQFRNNYFEGRSPNISYRLKENYILSRDANGTTHGSCYCYDTDVPIVFYGPGIKAATSDHRAQTVDIVPTLIDIMGLNPTGNLDGASLYYLIKK